MASCWHRRSWLPVLMLSPWIAGTALAAVDLSGAWTVQYETLPAESWAIVQIGSTLSVTVGGGSIAGTIDPETGTFQVISPPTPCPVAVLATATPDGNTFSGTFTETTVSCPGGPPTCTCVPSSSQAVSGCRVGTCPGDDPCPAGAALERTFVKLSRLATAPGDAQVTMRGELAFPSPPNPALDPAQTGLRLVLRNGDDTVALDQTIPAGTYEPATGAGWKANQSGRAFKFRSPSASAALKLSRRDPGRVKVKVEIRGLNVATPIPPLDVVAVTNPAASPGPQCGQVSFAAGTCAFGRSSSVLVCR
jgi:hypothetical protein